MVAPEHCGAAAVAAPLCAALARAAAARTPPPPAPLPPLVEAALEALVAVVDAAQEVGQLRRDNACHVIVHIKTQHFWGHILTTCGAFRLELAVGCN